jgi:hypothetical protein
MLCFDFERPRSLSPVSEYAPGYQSWVLARNSLLCFLCCLRFKCIVRLSTRVARKVSRMGGSSHWPLGPWRAKLI